MTEVTTFSALAQGSTSSFLWSSEKGLQTGSREADVPTGADMVLCLKDLKDSTRKCLAMINICKTAKYKTAQKSIAFLRNNNEHAEKFRKKVSLTTVSKNETECLELKLR